MFYNITDNELLATYSFNDVNNGGFSLSIVLVLKSGLFADERPQPVQIDWRTPLGIAP